MDLAEIELSPDEWDVLCRAESGPVPDDVAPRLRQLKLLELDRRANNGRMPQPTGKALITDRGIAYLRYVRARQARERREAVRYWITTAIAVAALGLSIIALIY